MPQPRRAMRTLRHPPRAPSHDSGTVGQSPCACYGQNCSTMMTPEPGTIAYRLCTDGSVAATREEAERDCLVTIALPSKEIPRLRHRRGNPYSRRKCHASIRPRLLLSTGPT
jgi:hypothetical protein